MISWELSPLKFRTLGLIIASDPELYLPPEEIKSEITTCACEEREIIRDNGRGECICSMCGLVIEDHELIQQNIVKTDKREDVRDHHFLTIFKQKPLTDRDVKLCHNPTEFQRQHRVDSYYSSEERQYNDVERDLKRIKEVCHLRDDIMATAWKHYKNLSRCKLFQGKSQFEICASLMFLAANQQNFNLQLQIYTNKTNEFIEPITKSDIMHGKIHILQKAKEIGYHIEMKALSNQELVSAYMYSVRDTKGDQFHRVRPENEYTMIECRLREILKITEKRMRRFGTMQSFIPAMMYYASRELDCPMTYEEVTYNSFVSATTVRLRYKKLCELYGEPKKKIAVPIAIQTK